MSSITDTWSKSFDFSNIGDVGGDFGGVFKNLYEESFKSISSSMGDISMDMDLKELFPEGGLEDFNVGDFDIDGEDSGYESADDDTPPPPPKELARDKFKTEQPDLYKALEKKFNNDTVKVEDYIDSWCGTGGLTNADITTLKNKELEGFPESAIPTPASDKLKEKDLALYQAIEDKFTDPKEMERVISDRIGSDEVTDNDIEDLKKWQNNDFTDTVSTVQVIEEETRADVKELRKNHAEIYNNMNKASDTNKDGVLDTPERIKRDDQLDEEIGKDDGLSAQDIDRVKIMGSPETKTGDAFKDYSNSYDKTGTHDWIGDVNTPDTLLYNDTEEDKTNWAATRKQLFEAFDFDKDGKLNKEETEGLNSYINWATRYDKNQVAGRDRTWSWDTIKNRPIDQKVVDQLRDHPYTPQEELPDVKDRTHVGDSQY